MASVTTNYGFDVPTSSDLVKNGALAIRTLDVAPTVLVANLPYNVSVPVFLHLLEFFPTLRTGVVMVQAEVADRLAGKPNSKEYIYYRCTNTKCCHKGNTNQDRRNIFHYLIMPVIVRMLDTPWWI